MCVNLVLRDCSVNSAQKLREVSIFTTPICIVSGVIVFSSSVCVCVCVLPLSWLNGQIYRPEFRYVGQVEGYLGQVLRSRS